MLKLTKEEVEDLRISLLDYEVAIEKWPKLFNKIRDVVPSHIFEREVEPMLEEYEDMFMTSEYVKDRLLNAQALLHKKESKSWVKKQKETSFDTELGNYYGSVGFYTNEAGESFLTLDNFDGVNELEVSKEFAEAFKKEFAPKPSKRSPEEKVKFYEKQIKRLADGLAEKRSDISEILDDILEGHEINLDHLECRLIIGTLPDGTRVEYDTLTTLMTYEKSDGEWETLDEIEYTEA